MIEMSTIQVVLGMVLVLLMHVFNVLALRSRSPRGKLHRQGIHGPSPHFYFGNIPEMKTLLLQVQSAPTTQVKDKDQHVSLSHKWPFTLFPHIQKWINQYGPLYLFSTGTIQWLMVTDIKMVKEIIMYTSLDLGKPTYLSKDLGPLLGQGILSASGQIWLIRGR
ncbi:hypothetical protein GLYMA_03G106633v4 [Glycine max]|uniref:cytochrome P450 714C2 n=1 Tax=Glycine max TaxID=3847 RepID=UPI000294B84B|nr:cytochrome P450 714C2 [Glycine max]KAG4393519.1 hypothetical protein GLYMA_03G106633v4 [Glycine max]KAH1069399.1 hypothetical protein GYH30_006850 [Glycine max]